MLALSIVAVVVAVNAAAFGLGAWLYKGE